MAEKTLFPGADETEMQRRAQEEQRLQEAAEKQKLAMEEAAEKKRIADQEAAKKAEFDKAVKALYSKFGNKAEIIRAKMGVRALALWRFVKPQMIFLGIMYVLWILGFVTGGEFIVENEDRPGHEGFNFFAMAVSKTDLQAGDRVFEKTDSPALTIGRAAVNPLLETYNFPTVFKKDAYTELKNYDLRIIRAYFGLIVVILSAVSASIKTRKDMVELNKDAIQIRNAKLQDIRKLLKLWRKKDVQNIKLEDFVYVDMVQKIISHMSSKDASVFQQILQGEQTVSSSVAVSIMKGHFDSHPEDVQLVLDKFEEKSIPVDFWEYCQHLVKKRK